MSGGSVIGLLMLLSCYYGGPNDGRRNANAQEDPGWGQRLCPPPLIGRAIIVHKQGNNTSGNLSGNSPSIIVWFIISPSLLFSRLVPRDNSYQLTALLGDGELLNNNNNKNTRKHVALCHSNRLQTLIRHCPGSVDLASHRRPSFSLDVSQNPGRSERCYGSPDAANDVESGRDPADL